MTRQALALRWTQDPIWRDLRPAVMAWLLGASPDRPELPKIEGRWDLRGLSFDTPSKALDGIASGIRFQVSEGKVDVHAAEWVGLDLSQATMIGLRFTDTHVSRCKFDGSNSRDWRLWNSRVSDSSFEGSNLEESALGTDYQGASNLWQSVSFDGARMTGAMFMGGALEQCTFKKSLLRRTLFKHVRLTGCVFAGQLRDVEFDGRASDAAAGPAAMDGCDFSDAVIDDVVMRGYIPRDVRMPPDAAVRFIENFPRVSREALARLDGRSDQDSQILTAVLENEELPLEFEGTAWLLNLRDIAKAGGAAFAGFVDAELTRAQASVGS